MRFLLYSHDGLGLGHTRRNLAIANQLFRLATDASILLVTGVNDVNDLGGAPGIGTLKLPSLRKAANGSYHARNIKLAASEMRSLRAALLLTAVKSFRPDVILVDKHPFGASGEFREGLEYARAQGGRLVLGLRDILDERATVLKEWGPRGLLKRIGEFYDLVLVYGQPGLYDPRVEYDFPPAAVRRTRFCGYVVNEDTPAQTRSGLRWLMNHLEDKSRPTVLATAGGGEDGFFLLETFIRTAAKAPWQGIVITGPMTPAADLATLKRLASDSNVLLHTFVPGLSEMFWTADALVSMGGYNTIAEALSRGLPVVCVPRVTPRSEQLIRAKSFEAFGLLQAIMPEDLNVGLLRDRIEVALGTSRQQLLDAVSGVLTFDGARHAASQLLALASKASPEDAETPSHAMA